MVKINDRGPFVKGRDLDLSKEAARKLGMIEKGVIPVKIETLNKTLKSLLIMATNACFDFNGLLDRVLKYL